MAQPNSSPDPRQNPTPKTPIEGDRREGEKQNADDRTAQPGRSDQLANSNQPHGDQPRRYDEADPNWTEPDVQMQNKNH